MAEYLPKEETSLRSPSIVPKTLGAVTSDEFLRINVGGRPFIFRSATLKGDSHNWSGSSRLHEFSRKSHPHRLNSCDGFLRDTDEYFFERPPEIFAGIYDYLTTGNLHKTGTHSAERFALELAYWRLPRVIFTAECCTDSADGCYDRDYPSPLFDECDGSAKDHSPRENSNKSDISFIRIVHKDEYANLCCATQRRNLGQFFENPHSSSGAKIFSVASVGFVIASIGALILGSMPELQVDQQITGVIDEDDKLEKVPNPTLIYVEYCCIAWFCSEYVIRFLVAPKKWQFVKSPLNIIDLLTIIPFWIELTLTFSGIVASEKLRKFKGTMLVIRILRVLRVARVFRLARYSSGLKSFGETVKNSRSELGMLALFLLTGIIFYSTVIYFLEKDEENSKFTSIPAACWWCIVTMTTVGYGDVVPKTIGGKLVASVASISGVLVLAFPITMIVDNFARNYDKDLPVSPPPETIKRRRRTTSYI